MSAAMRQVAMKGSHLTVYVANQNQRKNHRTVVEWVLNEARQIGIQGRQS